MSPNTRLAWAGSLLGFALGGFFDGILLHQILQWHHLLSLVEGVDTLREQVLADGMLHVAMYFVAIAGMVLLHRARGQLVKPGSGRRLLGWVLIGFAAWHWTDSILSHWLLGLHRIRTDSDNPLAWDLLWFGLFGVLPLLGGVLLARGRRPGPPGASTAGGLAALVLVVSVWAARPPNTGTAVVLFRPGVSDGQAMTAILRTEGDVLWRSRGVWAVRWRGPAREGRLYAGGALLVGGGAIGAGCLAWSRAS